MTVCSNNNMRSYSACIGDVAAFCDALLCAVRCLAFMGGLSEPKLASMCHSSVDSEMT